MANSFKKRVCFVIWGCTNTFWAVYNAANHQYAQALLYAFNLIMAVIGFVKWGAPPNRSPMEDESEAERR
ncbi:MAG: hypothetical protein QM689_12670 [Oscillospiraceae bacterium]